MRFILKEINVLLIEKGIVIEKQLLQRIRCMQVVFTKTKKNTVEQESFTDRIFSRIADNSISRT